MLIELASNESRKVEGPEMVGERKALRVWRPRLREADCHPGHDLMCENRITYDSKHILFRCLMN